MRFGFFRRSERRWRGLHSHLFNPGSCSRHQYRPKPNKGIADAQTSSDNALVSHTGLNGTVADIVGSTLFDRTSVYVVGKGDTLSEIADMFGVSRNTILLANDLKSAGDINVGDTLVIFGVKYTVVKGNTLKSIAKKYNADADEIAQFNGLDPEAPLEVGSTIIVPGAEPISTAPIAKKSSSRKIGKEPYLGGGVLNSLVTTVILCQVPSLRRHPWVEWY